VGHEERFTPSRLSDRNGFVKETLAGAGATDGNAPIAAVQETTHYTHAALRCRFQKRGCEVTNRPEKPDQDRR
jgi:hypothetical protein